MNHFDLLCKELDRHSGLDGISPAEVIELPEPLRGVLTGILRAGSTSLKQLAIELNLSVEETRRLVDRMVDKGFLTCSRGCNEKTPCDTIYRVRLARVRKRHLPLDF